MRPFEPCWWLQSGHLQTWAGFLLRRPILNTSLEAIKLADGDILELHWLHTEKPDAPVLLLLHGLEGSVYSSYIQGMLNVAQQNQWRAIVMHFRGCQGRANTIPQSYHAGKTDDLLFTLNHIRNSFPNAKALFTVGYSLGGNILLKFLGENPEQTYIDRAASISLPFDLAATSHFLRKGFRKYYEYRFLRTLKRSIARKISLGMNMPLDLKRLHNIHTLYDFDNQVTAPLHHFKNADEYYKNCSCKQFLSRIKTPSLIVHAIDDPFVPKEVIPKDNEVSSHITLLISKHGGHVGFIGQENRQQFSYWLEKCIPEYLLFNSTD